jgi:hypothetical protein
MFFQFKSNSRDVCFHLLVKQKKGIYSLMLIEGLTLLAMGIAHLLCPEMILFGLQDFQRLTGLIVIQTVWHPLEPRQR